MVTSPTHSSFCHSTSLATFDGLVILSTSGYFSCRSHFTYSISDHTTFPPPVGSAVIHTPTPCIFLLYHQFYHSTINFSPNATPGDVFEALPRTDDDDNDHIVTKTNRFAAQRSSPLL